MLARTTLTYLATSPVEEEKKVTARRILIARPKKGVDYSELRKAAKKRFEKTLARLAE